MHSGILNCSINENTCFNIIYVNSCGYISYIKNNNFKTKKGRLIIFSRVFPDRDSFETIYNS